MRSKSGLSVAPSLRARGVQLLARREHSSEELRRKLMRYALADSAAAAVPSEVPGRREQSALPPVPGDAEDHLPLLADPAQRKAQAAARVEDALAWLLAQGHLDNQRFIDSRVHVRSSRFGNLRIRHELAQHGLTLDAEASQSLKDTEINRAHEVWSRKFGPSPARDMRSQSRQARFLSQRGFTPEVIRRVLKAPVDGSQPSDE